MNKRVLVIGASQNRERYSFRAVNLLRDKGYEVCALALRPGQVGDVVFQTGMPAFEGVDTVTLYVGPKNQGAFYDYVLSLRPRRVIFNPGTENEEFQGLLRDQGILVLEACTLVLLTTGQF